MDEKKTPCSRCQTPLEAGDIRCSICGQAAPHDIEKISRTQVQVLRCTGCGAAIGYDPKRQAPSCSFCNSLVKIETIEDPMEQSSGYLPFTVTANEAHAALKSWLGSLGWFRPGDLESSATLQELRPLWWVAWVFDANSKISWAADSNADAGRSAWAPHSGQTEVNFQNILASASRGLSLEEVAEITGGMDLNSVQPEPRGADNATVERFDVQRSQARQQVGQALHNMAVRHVQEHSIPGTRFRNVNVSTVVESLVTRRLSLPAYVLAYRYKQELYRVVICGQNQNLIVGKAPYSILKITITVAAICAVVLLVFAMFAAG